MNKARDIVKYPGVPAAMDGNTAAVACERESSDGAGAYPITPSSQMGEYWAEAAAEGRLNIAGRPLVFIEPEGEHAAAGVTAGMSMGGLRAANFSSGQGIAYMHESLYAAVGKRLTYVLNMGCRAMTKATLNVHAGHDDYHCVDDTGFFQLFAKNAQHVADLNILAHRIAELSLNPGLVAQDGFLTTHLVESLRLPERELIEEFLGLPEDIINCPTPAQAMLFGPTRRRIPELWDVDLPLLSGAVQNQDAYMQSVAAQRPYFFDHIRPIADEAFAEFVSLTGRRYAPILEHRVDDADYLIIAQGSAVPTAEAVADHLRASRRLKVGVIDLVMFRPFPADLLADALRGKTGVVVLERLDQPLAIDPPLTREIRSVLGKCLENGRAGRKTSLPHPGLTPYNRLEDVPEIFTALYGLGSRDLQPGHVIGAVENMLPDGAQHRTFYLGINFLPATAASPVDAVHAETLSRAYPNLASLAVDGSENPNLMPEGCITIRMHSIGGWGAITTGKNLASTLFDLLGYHIKANPKYGSEKKGQPTTFYLAAAPEPIRVNCEYQHVDVVLSPDPNVFHHTNALAGLAHGGTLIIQSTAQSADAFWRELPATARATIEENNLRVFYLDAFRIAREEATDADLELRMQGIAFQGAFFAALPLLDEKGFDEARLLEAMKTQLNAKFGAKGARVVADNLRVIRRGYDELTALDLDAVESADTSSLPAPAVPIAVRHLPESQVPVSDIHRFWAINGSRYARGQGDDNPADPFMALSAMPASSALFRDLTGIRNQHPQWIPENCTACGKCWTVCPDTAMPAVVNEMGQVLETARARVAAEHGEAGQLPRAVRTLEAELKRLIGEANGTGDTTQLMAAALSATREKTLAAADSQDRAAITDQLDWLADELTNYQFALTRPFFELPELDESGSGGLLSIVVNPTTCKGCGECVAVCNDDALINVEQTTESVASLRETYDFWQALPTTPQRFIRIDNLERGIGVLDNLLLDKNVYLPFTSGDGACLGCSEKTILHLFVATVEALMQPRVEAQIQQLDDLLARLEQHVQLKLVHEIDLEDTATLKHILTARAEDDLTLAALASDTEHLRGDEPIDQRWLAKVVGLIHDLKDLRWRYAEGPNGRGRASMGILNATGCSSVWGSTFPYNPYPFPWANHLFQDSPSLALGVFEAHMRKMAGGFKTVRLAEAELAGNLASEEDALAAFTWENFTEEELKLCPPVVVVGGDGAMYDIGFQNLSRAMMTGKPLKVIVLDTQVYSNTGGQACTSGFLGQASDMAPFGAAKPGKSELRKELGLIAMAHRTTYVLQSSIAHTSHLIGGFIEGLTSARPALFNCYATCQPEHGIGDDKGFDQSKLAVESRAYPLFSFDPDRGATWAECLDLSGNPAPREDWPSYEQRTATGMVETLPLTFADFAATETRFRKHFRTVPRDAWHEDMVPLATYLELAPDGRTGKHPYIWALSPKDEPIRLAVSETLAQSAEDRRAFWRLLKELAGVTAEPAASESQMRDEARREIIDQLVANLFTITGGGPGATAAAAPPGEAPAASEASNESYMAPWLDTDACTACDECTNLNPDIFAYNDARKAYIRDPDGGPYKDLVLAAERCTARVIHPGLPKRRDEPGIDDWIARGERFN